MCVRESDIVASGTTTARDPSTAAGARPRPRFEFTSQYREAYEAAGMICAGENPDTGLVETVELSGHPWYVGVQYHPEYRSTVLHPSPLFLAFVKEAIKHGGERHQA